jgi:hypothetical protein
MLLLGDSTTVAVDRPLEEGIAGTEQLPGAALAFADGPMMP